MKQNWHKHCRRALQALKQYGRLLWFVCRHPRTPWYARALCLLTLAYLVSPLDLIPDVIPVFGILDDLLLVPALLWLALRLVPRTVWDEARAQTANTQEPPRALAWSGAMAVVAVWVALVYLLTLLLWGRSAGPLSP